MASTLPTNSNHHQQRQVKEQMKIKGKAVLENLLLRPSSNNVSTIPFDVFPPLTSSVGQQQPSQQRHGRLSPRTFSVMAKLELKKLQKAKENAKTPPDAVPQEESQMSTLLEIQRSTGDCLLKTLEMDLQDPQALAHLPKLSASLAKSYNLVRIVASMEAKHLEEQQRKPRVDLLTESEVNLQSSQYFSVGLDSSPTLSNAYTSSSGGWGEVTAEVGETLPPKRDPWAPPFSGTTLFNTNSSAPNASARDHKVVDWMYENRGFLELPPHHQPQQSAPYELSEGDRQQMLEMVRMGLTLTDPSILLPKSRRCTGLFNLGSRPSPTTNPLLPMEPYHRTDESPEVQPPLHPRISRSAVVNEAATQL